MIRNLLPVKLSQGGASMIETRGSGSGRCIYLAIMQTARSKVEQRQIVYQKFRIPSFLYKIHPKDRLGLNRQS